jgi:hypothetical protein
MNIINKTPHEITLISEITQNTIKAWPPCPKSELIRLESSTIPSDSIECEGVAVATSRTVFGSATGLPDQSPDCYYVVSQLVKNAYSSRTDLLVPAEVLRDSAGRITGCCSLGR